MENPIIDKEYQRWLSMAQADPDLLPELLAMDGQEKEDAFYRDLAFGTGGLRGIIGAGTNRMNVYTVGKASQGLANYLKKHFSFPSVVIGYDSRIKSGLFAQVSGGIFAANGIEVYIWPELMPVPTVSFATRYVHASAGVMITASHNPTKYKGHTHTGHVHTDACYTVTQTRICESTEPDHVHTEECSEAHQELTCTQDTGCYDENGNLICGLEETQGHAHSEDCYETQLVCGQEETEPHTHTDSCYQVQRELVCGQEEVILHTHTEGCRDEEGNLTCGMVEAKEHVHDETCLPEEEVAPHTLAAQNEDVGTNFGPYITSTQVQVKSGDQWVDIVDGTVTDGSSIQVTIYYSITDSDIVTADNNIIYYQLPNGIRLTKEENGPVEVGDKNAGTYTITTDGRITITFNKGFADGDPFAGNISFHGEVSLADIEEGDDIVFGGAGGTITIVLPSPFKI